MKRSIIIAILMVIAIWPIQAQAQTVQQEYAIDSLALLKRNNYLKYGVADGWFIGADFGAQTFFGYKGDKGPFSERITPAFSFSIGKWITPDFGLRLTYNGNRTKGFTHRPTDFSTSNTPNSKGGYPFKYRYNNYHFDVLFNLNEIFGRFKEQRKYNLIFFLGGGKDFVKPIGKSDPVDHEFSVNTGFINDFYIAKHVALSLSFQVIGQRRIVNLIGEKGFIDVWDFMVPLTAGVKVNIGNMYKHRGISTDIAKYYAKEIDSRSRKDAKGNMDGERLFAPNYEDSLKLEKIHYMPYRLNEGWFISAGAGAQTYFGNHADLGPWSGRITPAYEISIGKWFLPYAGISFSYIGRTIKGFTKETSVYTTSQINSHGGYAYKFKYNTVNFHFLCDLRKLLSAAKEQGYKYSPILSFGAGIERIRVKRGADSDNEFTFNIGFNNTYDICEHIAIYAKVAALFNRPKINLNYIYHNYKGGCDVIFPVTVGIQFNIGKHKPSIGYKDSFVNRLHKKISEIK